MRNRFLLLALILAASVSGPSSVWAQDGGASAAGELESAIQVYKSGEWESAITVLQALLDSARLSPDQATLARKTLAEAFIADKEYEKAIDTYKDIVRDDHTFSLLSLGTEPPQRLLMAFAQAQFDVREEERRAVAEARGRTSRDGAFLRSAAVPGWGQRYRGWNKRGIVMAGITAGSVIYAVVADKSFRDSRDAYDNGAEGEDFDRLFSNYSDKSDRADLALGIVAATWLLNIVDAASQGPNITGLPGGLSVAPAADNGLQVVLARGF